MGRTNGLSQYAIDLAGEKVAVVDVVAAADGHVPKQVHWDGGSLPENYVLGLERGLRMGGKVVDERGRPIAGARVLPWFAVPDGDGEEVAAAVTDAQGAWHSDVLPPRSREASRHDRSTCWSAIPIMSQRA